MCGLEPYFSDRFFNAPGRRPGPSFQSSHTQLKPGLYTVTVEAAGFERRTSEPVSAGLGQKQTVNFSLKLATASGSVEVTGEVPLVNIENPNTATTLSAHALEDLPNPGGDMTYPLQFAAGALMNTAGSGNNFVGGSNGHGNVQFNGLPALANGYIVDGLETNDPLTRLSAIFPESRSASSPALPAAPSHFPSLRRIGSTRPAVVWRDSDPINAEKRGERAPCKRR